MIRLVISPQADDDLTAIWQYIGVENGNVEAATQVLAAIRDTLLILPGFPHLGRPCTEFADDVPRRHRISIEGYIAYYRLHGDTLEVGRIVHERRNRQVMLYPSGNESSL